MKNLTERLDGLLVCNLGYFNYQNYVSRMDLKEDERVLEVGCGGGNLSRFLSRKLSFGKLVCLDNSEFWIEKIKKRLQNYKNIEFLQENLLNFKEEKKFDSIIVNYVLHDSLEKKKFVEVLFNFLIDKGRIYIREPMRESHGMASEEIKRLFVEKEFIEKSSDESYSFPLRGKVYEGVWKKN